MSEEGKFFPLNVPHFLLILISIFCWGFTVQLFLKILPVVTQMKIHLDADMNSCEPSPQASWLYLPACMKHTLSLLWNMVLQLTFSNSACEVGVSKEDTSHLMFHCYKELFIFCAILDCRKYWFFFFLLQWY